MYSKGCTARILHKDISACMSYGGLFFKGEEEICME